MDKKLEILQKFNKTVEDLDFSIEDISVEDLNAKMEELYGEQKVEPVAFSATYRQKRDALNNALDPIIVKDDEGNYLEETYAVYILLKDIILDIYENNAYDIQQELKKKYPTYIDETCQLFDEIAISAGERGHQMILPYEAILTLANAEIAEIIM